MTKGKTARAHVELRRRYAEIEQQRIDPPEQAKRLDVGLQFAERPPHEGQTRIPGRQRLGIGRGVRVLVDRDQPATGTEHTENRPAVPAATVGRIDADAVLARFERGQRGV